MYSTPVIANCKATEKSHFHNFLDLPLFSQLSIEFVYTKKSYLFIFNIKMQNGKNYYEEATRYMDNAGVIKIGFDEAYKIIDAIKPN